MISFHSTKVYRWQTGLSVFPGRSRLTQSGLTAGRCKRTRLLSGCEIRPRIVLSLIVMCDRWFKKLAAVSDGLTAELSRDRRHAIVTAQGPQTDPRETHTAETTITVEDFKQTDPAPHPSPRDRIEKNCLSTSLFSLYSLHSRKTMVIKPRIARTKTYNQTIQYRNGSTIPFIYFGVAPVLIAEGTRLKLPSKSS